MHLGWAARSTLTQVREFALEQASYKLRGDGAASNWSDSLTRAIPALTEGEITPCREVDQSANEAERGADLRGQKNKFSENILTSRITKKREAFLLVTFGSAPWANYDPPCREVACAVRKLGQALIYERRKTKKAYIRGGRGRAAQAQRSAAQFQYEKASTILSHSIPSSCYI